MAFIDIVLRRPSYGWQDESGNLVKPSPGQLFKEFFHRLNVIRDKRNWLPFMSWLKVLIMVPFLALFIFKFFSWGLLLAAFVYSMFIMGTHGTIWHHRYCTHRAYTFRNRFWQFVTQNLTVSMIPEEIYVVSHHVHHVKSDQPGDPYNAQGGFLYCFLADVNHQPIAWDLNEAQYGRVRSMMRHTGIRANTYKQYVKWGSYQNPGRAILYTLANWSFWYGAFFLLGGHALACTLFGAAGFWAVGVRTFNYEGHGKGENRQREGIDYNRRDMSVNQLWPGIVAGEWHNNHHLYPRSARSGFKPHQVDMAWYYIKLLSMLGAVSSYQDSKEDFYERYERPHREGKSLPQEELREV
ncbi:fatty acid desaturase [Dyadobacter sp. CY261]|uniref:fatty acid desaturase n=1 Tax=Dyadobacter sp. CY261 TaxID=2907203 RepID=UPI001F3EFD3C|nr:fatty acid desaturase [Dyadobacter sp. CY261]MCF0072929.1 fatty acid desaturase [Dyadobacter sp. CY261]